MIGGWGRGRCLGFLCVLDAIRVIAKYDEKPRKLFLVVVSDACIGWGCIMRPVAPPPVVCDLESRHR